MMLSLVISNQFNKKRILHVHQFVFTFCYFFFYLHLHFYILQFISSSPRDIKQLKLCRLAFLFRYIVLSVSRMALIPCLFSLMSPVLVPKLCLYQTSFFKVWIFIFCQDYVMSQIWRVMVLFIFVLGQLDLWLQPVAGSMIFLT